MDNLRKRLADVLLEYISQETGVADVDTSLDLIESGILDSLLIIGLVSFIHTRFGVQAEPADISPKRFRSVDSLADWLIEKQQIAAKLA